jgi:hypothetical protein
MALQFVKDEEEFDNLLVRLVGCGGSCAYVYVHAVFAMRGAIRIYVVCECVLGQHHCALHSHRECEGRRDDGRLR